MSVKYREVANIYQARQILDYGKDVNRDLWKYGFLVVCDEMNERIVEGTFDYKQCRNKFSKLAKYYINYYLSFIRFKEIVNNKTKQWIIDRFIESFNNDYRFWELDFTGKSLVEMYKPVTIPSIDKNGNRISIDANLDPVISLIKRGTIVYQETVLSFKRNDGIPDVMDLPDGYVLKGLMIGYNSKSKEVKVKRISPNLNHNKLPVFYILMQSSEINEETNRLEMKIDLLW